jgi:hypothetical protein
MDEMIANIAPAPFINTVIVVLHFQDLEWSHIQ